MKYSGPSIVTDRQVGDSPVTVIENDEIFITHITETESRDTGSGVEVFYKVAAFTEKWFPAAEVYDDSTDAKADIPENDTE